MLIAEIMPGSMLANSIEIDPSQGGSTALTPGDKDWDIWNENKDEEEEEEEVQDPFYFEYE